MSSPGIVTAAVEVADSTRRRIATRLLPFLFILLHHQSYLDRTSLAYAALGMTHDLGFSDRVFGLAWVSFFRAYVALQIPGALLVDVGRAPDDFCHYDHVGIADRVDCVGAYAGSTLFGATGIRGR